MRDYTELEKIRLAKLERLRAAGQEPYPTRAERSHTSAQALAEYAQHPPADTHTAAGAYTVAGRIKAIRVMGKSAFVHLEDGAGRLQLYFRTNDLGEERYRLFQDVFDLGDFVQASGGLFTTKTGEVTLWVKDFRMLAKAISPLPAAKEEIVDGQKRVYSAFDNPEARYRERYADLAVNAEVREIFRARARICSALRKFLDGQGFLEVETPILQPLYGGAAARPFVTHHNQLHQDLYLRISFELYLKRLLVGGLERVYEIGRDFRNEGVSFKHNPEFTQLEFYWAYADYEQVMRLTENMIAFVADEVLGTRTLTYQGQTLNLNPGWPRVPLAEGIAEFAGVDIHAHPTAAGLLRAMEAKGIHADPKSTRGKLVEKLLGDFVEPHLIQPTFIVDYPRDISPLAKARPGDDSVVERFEGYMAGFELCNAFTELNDPLDQEQRFIEMGRDYAADSEDTHPLDEDYLRAMRYGMPPNGGFGMGVDRLTMLLTDKATIREVILFPHLRSREE
ncbi:MAG: lysine--tRNA ligase [Anaerolineales bacterium]|nr:lysine--tRNA ligase [Anaerolineales bacterium]